MTSMNFTHQWLSKERYSGKHLGHEGRVRGAHSSRGLLSLHRAGSEAIAGLSPFNLFFLLFFSFLQQRTLYRHLGAAASQRMEQSAVIQKCHVSTRSSQSPSAFKTRLALSPSLLKCSWEIQQLWKRSTFQITRLCVCVCAPGREGGRLTVLVEGCEAGE